MATLILLPCLKEQALGTKEPIIKEESVRNINLADIKSFLGKDNYAFELNILPGDSVFDRDNAIRLALEQEKVRRTLARERTASYQRGGSYTRGEAEVIGTSYEQCITYAKRKAGISRGLGYAGRTTSQGNTPKVGAIGLEKYRGHAVYVEAINGDEITITESNFYKGKITRRVLNIRDFRGFVYG